MSKPLKIAFVYDLIYPFTTGGAEKRFWELARIMERQGHQVHLFGMKFWKGDDDLIRDGIHLHGVSLPSARFTATGVRDVCQVLRYCAGLWARLACDDFDIIDCNEFPYLHFFGLKILSWFKRFALVVTWQELWGRYWYEFAGPITGSIGRLIERMVAGCAPFIIVHSRLVETALRKILAAHSHCVLIPNGIPLEAIEGCPTAGQRSDVIFAGRLLAHKQVDRLLEALPAVKQVVPDLRAIIIGQGVEKPRLQELCAQLGIASQVAFLDFLKYEDMISLLKASRVYVFPSKREGFGIAALEAMACGLPVITVRSRLNAASELVVDGANGFVCADESDQIAEKVIALLQHEDVRLRMSGEALRYAQKFGWEQVAAQNLELYRLAARRKSRKFFNP